MPGEEISIREAQQRIDEWIRTTGVRYFSELTNMAILTEEVGEVARLMSRLYGDQSFKESDQQKNLPDELADVLWVLICIANQTGIDLTTALKRILKRKISGMANGIRRTGSLNNYYVLGQVGNGSTYVYHCPCARLYAFFPPIIFSNSNEQILKSPLRLTYRPIISC